MNAIELLRARREGQGRSAANVARALNLGRNTVAQWERGEREPSFEDLQRWAAELGMSASIVVRESREGDLPLDDAHLSREQRMLIGALVDAIGKLTDAEIATYTLLFRRVAGPPAEAAR